MKFKSSVHIVSMVCLTGCCDKRVYSSHAGLAVVLKEIYKTSVPHVTIVQQK